MQTISPVSTPPRRDLTNEGRAQARMDRIVRPDAERSRSSDSEGPQRRNKAPGRARDGFRLGPIGWMLVQAVAIVLIFAGVLVWPPVDACRDQDRKTGFYSGDSLDKCIRRGIAARIQAADQRIKMVVRGSGG